MALDLNKIKTAFDSFLDTKVSKLDQKQKIGICIAALAVPVVAFSFLVFSPKNKEIKGLEKNKASLETEIKKVEATARQLEKHKAEMRETELQFKAASMLLPEGKEIPSLLTNISSQGTNSGLDFLSFKPQGEIPKEFYAEIPVNIAVRGPYHNVGVFLDKISKLPRIVTVSNVKMGSPVLVDSEMFLDTTFNLITYRSLEPAEEEKTQKEKKGGK